MDAQLMSLADWHLELFLFTIMIAIMIILQTPAPSPVDSVTFPNRFYGNNTFVHVLFIRL